MSVQNYGQESITSLKGADRVRMRPGVIFGSNDITGCTHAVFEIVANAVDEAKEGFCTAIKIAYSKDGEVTVTDNGRGMPLDWNEKEGRFNWDLIFCELYAGGKYDKEGSYGDSLGLNGLGACATQYASEYMDVTVYRDNTKYSISFRKGEVVGELLREKIESSKTGTIIKFKPDLEVFDAIKIDSSEINDMARRQAMIHKNLKIIVAYEGEQDVTWLFPEGTKGFLEKFVDFKTICDVHSFQAEDVGRDREDKDEYRVKMDMAITFSRDVSLVELYHNSSWLENGGAPDKALRKAVVRAFDSELKDRGKYNKNDSKIIYRDIESIINCIISTSSPGYMVSYENQTKKSITNKFIEEALNKFIYNSVLRLLREDAQGEKVLDTAIIYKKAREAEESFKQRTLKSLTAAADNVLTRPSKFSDCRSKIVEERELYIVEGDSAQGACLQARNAEFQAIMPIRGKIKNCLKSDIKGILGSDIIVDLLRILGCGIEIPIKSSKESKALGEFSMDRLRWGKVIICTDADEDGWQIRCLVLAMFYKLMPTVLREGKVYIVKTPLYELEYKGHSDFAYTDSERDSMMKHFEAKGVKNVKIHRSKGLGENDPDMMELTTMSPYTRQLVQAIYDDESAEMAGQIFNALLGDDIESRKFLITEYAKLVHGYTVL